MKQDIPIVFYPVIFFFCYGEEDITHTKEVVYCTTQTEEYL